MPITIARTSPPSGLVSCSLPAACAVSGRTHDATRKAVVSITFNAARMAGYLSEIEFTSLAGFRHPSKRWVSSRRARGWPLLWSPGRDEYRFVAIRGYLVHRFRVAGFFERPVGNSVSGRALAETIVLSSARPRKRTGT